MPPTAPTPSPAVVSLVLHLRDDVLLRRAALSALRAHPAVELGPVSGPLLPLVAEVPAPMEFHRWIESLPGVAFVDVAFVELVSDPAA